MFMTKIQVLYERRNSPSYHFQFLDDCVSRTIESIENMEKKTVVKITINSSFVRPTKWNGQKEADIQKSKYVNFSVKCANYMIKRLKCLRLL